MKNCRYVGARVPRAPRRGMMASHFLYSPPPELPTRSACLVRSPAPPSVGDPSRSPSSSAVSLQPSATSSIRNTRLRSASTCSLQRMRSRLKYPAAFGLDPREAVADYKELVKSTNNQNPMQPRNLRSNDPEQVYYETLFADLNWFYERKEGAWKAYQS